MKFRIVFVTANFCGNSTKILDYLLKKSDLFEITAVIYDSGSKADNKRRMKRISAWYKHGGIFYIIWRIYLQLRNRKISKVRKFRYNLREITERYKIKLYEVGNINSEDSLTALKNENPDLGVSVGNRIISEKIFTIPGFGMINLHHGEIPKYRGGPPYFWELYNDEKSVCVSVHQIDKKLDHGSLYGMIKIPVEEGDDTTKLYARAVKSDYLLLENVIRKIALNEIDKLNVDFTNSKVNTIPKYSEVRNLKKRLGYFADPLGYRYSEIPEIKQ